MTYFAWTLAHIAFTLDEVELGMYNELPVLYNVDKGFLISPPKSDLAARAPERNFCNDHPRFINLSTDHRSRTTTPMPIHRKAIPEVSAADMGAFL